MNIERPQQKEVSQWYLQTTKRAELFDYGPTKGTIVIKPYGYAIWELIQQILDPMIKSLGCQNAYFPSLIPESLLSKEKEHVKGFSPECAVVTFAGGKKLKEPLIVRPTSETIMYSLFSKWIISWRDLPLKINQWCNVVRWELRPFPFLRTTEFLWHEGHTAHKSKEESDQQVLEVLKMYQHFFEEKLAIPVVIGKKTEREKFAGALYSTSCEALLIDGKGLQIATVHNLGQNFSKAFKILFQDIDGKRKYVWQTSWGISTRTIGGLILTHGDKKGLILPPEVAPIQIIIIPIWKNKKEYNLVIKASNAILSDLKSFGIRVELDASDHTPGWKFNEWELKGVPLRIEVGPREVKAQKLILVRRDNREKIEIKFKELKLKIKKILSKVQKDLFQRAKEFVNANTFEAKNFKKFVEILENQRGFIKAPWCGDSECERLVKEKTKATTRCIPFDGERVEGKCIHCGRKAKFIPIWARAY